MPKQLETVPVGLSMLQFRRSIAAPPATVWTAFTSPALIPAWLFARSAPMSECAFQPEAGGLVRYVWRKADGSELGLTGRIIEITPPSRLVHSEIYDNDTIGAESTVTTDFQPDGKGTLVVMTVDYPTPEARDAAAASSMAQGMEEAFVHLDRMLAT